MLFYRNKDLSKLNLYTKFIVKSLNSYLLTEILLKKSI